MKEEHWLKIEIHLFYYMMRGKHNGFGREVEELIKKKIRDDYELYFDKHIAVIGEPDYLQLIHDIIMFEDEIKTQKSQLLQKEI